MRASEWISDDYKRVSAWLQYYFAFSVARIGFETITFSVQEGAGFAELPVAVLGTTTLGGEVTVRFTTSDLTAIGQ